MTIAIIDKRLTYFSVLPFLKITTKNEVLQYLIKVSLFLFISKNAVIENRKINRFNICEKNLCTIGQFIKKNGITDSSYINR